MKNKIQIVLLLVFVMAIFGCKKSNVDIVYDKKYLDEIKEIRKEIGFFMGSGYVPGANVAISKNGKIIYSEAIGRASKDLDIKVSRQTKFRIGSLTELFTSSIYLKMVENGTLHPDSSVQHYYPEFPQKSSKISLENLVNHVSGIREANMQEHTKAGLNIGLEKGIEQFINDDLIAPSNQYQAPSIFNYNLLGVIMEKVEKQRFNKIFQSYLSDTLKMENTVLDNPYLIIKDRSSFFDHNMVSQIVNASTIDLRRNAPSEGALSTAEDLVKFGNAVLNSPYFAESTRKKMFEKIVLSNGVAPNMVNGWMLIQDREGNDLYGKEGSVRGGSAALLIYPHEELVIAIATNLTDASSKFPIFKIADHFLPKDENKGNKTAE